MSLSNCNGISQNESGCTKKGKKKNCFSKNGEVDTSNFSIEERLVSAVWVHERKLEKMSISQIKMNFKKRFGKPPPTKNTLYYWEKKLFSTGKVMDSKRSGRPCKRKVHIPSVKASLQQSPGLSLRARAEQLSLPRTTLKKILKEDLNIKNSDVSLSSENNSKASDECVQAKRQQATKNDIAMRSNMEQHQAAVANSTACSAVSTYSSYHEALPFTAALQHHLYPNRSHHQPTVVPYHSKIPSEMTVNYEPDLSMAPHMIHHFNSHGHHYNHHGYQTNT